MEHKQPSERKATWQDRAWPLGIMAALTVAVAFNVAMLTVSMQAPPDVVSDDYYNKGLNLKDIVAKERASDGLGWTVTLIPADNQAMVVSVRDAMGQPLDSLNGDIAFYRASNMELDIPGQSIQPAGGGTYKVSLPRNLEPGSWQAIATMTKGQQHYQKRHTIFVEKS